MGCNGAVCSWMNGRLMARSFLVHVGRDLCVVFAPTCDEALSSHPCFVLERVVNIVHCRAGFLRHLGQFVFSDDQWGRESYSIARDTQDQTVFKGHYPSPIPQPSKDEKSKPKRANMDRADPLPTTPGFEPPDDPLPDQEEFPAETDVGPTTEIFPNPGQREAIIETFPIDDSLSQWIILENSRGNEMTQAKNDVLIELFTDAFKRYGVKAWHKNGARTAEEKNYLKERYLKAIDGIGAARPDGSFEIDDKTWVDFNTVDNLKDGRTPSAREGRALEKIQRLYEAHQENSDILHFPKLRDVGLDEWRELMKPLVEDYFVTKWGKK